jgi:hypothetical protein
MRIQGLVRYYSIPLLTIAFGVGLGCTAAKKNVGQTSTPVLTELQLQSNLMSFADRSASILIAALEEFDALGPGQEARNLVFADNPYTTSAAYTIDDVMGRVAIERSQAIDQFMTRLAEERTETLRELDAEQ